MSTLTRTAKQFKSGVRIFAIVVIIYYVGILFVIPKTSDLIEAILPDPNPPNPIYGKLPPLKFEEVPINGPQPQFVLNTTSGKLPTDFPDKMTVYKFDPPPFSYLAGKKALDHAKILGFPESSLVSGLKGDVYRWRSLSTGGNLKIDLTTSKLELNTNLTERGKDYVTGSVNETNAVTFAKDLFSDIERIDDKYNEGESRVYLGKFTNNDLVESIQESSTQLARVDLFRSINGFKIFGPDPRKGLLHVVLTNPTAKESPFNYPIVQAQYWSINETAEPPATYNIIDVKDAWNEVIANRAVRSNVTPKGSNPFAGYSAIRVEQVLINNIYLAYYETPEYQQYLQPIYVFEGNFNTRGTSGGDITLYFPAISAEFIQEPQVEQPAAQPDTQPAETEENPL